MASPFLSQMLLFFATKSGDFGRGVTRGVTERGYIFDGEGLQNRVFRGGSWEGVKIPLLR